MDIYRTHFGRWALSIGGVLVGTFPTREAAEAHAASIEL